MTINLDADLRQTHFSPICMWCDHLRDSGADRTCDAFPDGICMDSEGAVWYADVPAKRCVRVREGGDVLQTIEIDRGCFACALGGEQGKTLFIMAAEYGGARDSGPARTGQVVAVQTAASRAGWP